MATKVKLKIIENPPTRRTCFRKSGKRFFFLKSHTSNTFNRSEESRKIIAQNLRYAHFPIMRDNEITILISSKLKAEIEYSSKTKSQIASEIGISKATLSQYLSGRILPSVPTLAKLCKALDCSADDILDFDKKN